MAWDFKTDPEFQEKLDWMETFVRDEIFPLETLGDVCGRPRVAPPWPRSPTR